MTNSKNFNVFILLLAAFIFPLPTKAQNTLFYNVRDFGAKGDGLAIDTKSIDKAIAQASRSGGGTVFFPAGNYLSTTIHLQSKVSIYLDQGSTLIAAAKGYDFPEENKNDGYQDYGHSHFDNSLIVGTGLHDIAILGPGRIWGRGLLRDTVPSGSEKGFGNKTISLKLCRNVTLRDFSVLNGGWFVALLNAVDNLVIDNVTMDTNRDGIDVISSKNVRITNCLINSPQDDAICLKSDYALGYPRATENVMIANCQVSGYDEGTLLDGTFQTVKKRNRTGRIKLGTESNGGFKNITITNCIFDYSRGLALETVDGGDLEDIIISNIVLRHIVNSPLFIRLGERMRAPAGTLPGKLRRVMISNMIAYDLDPSQGAFISGTKNNPIEDLTLMNIKFYFKGGGTKDMRSIRVPELEKDYPEPVRFGKTPSYAFFIRHLKGLRVNDVQTSFDQQEDRFAFSVEHVQDADFQNIFSRLGKDASLFQLRQVKRIRIQANSSEKGRYVEHSNYKIF